MLNRPHAHRFRDVVQHVKTAVAWSAEVWILSLLQPKVKNHQSQGRSSYTQLPLCKDS